MTQQTMTKEQILEKCNLTPSHIKEIVPRDGKGGSVFDRTILAMEEFKEQELSKEREKAKKLVEALEEIADMTGNILIYKKAKQSLTEYKK